MASSLLNVLTYTLIPVTAATVGGAIAAWRTPGPKVRSFVQHFAAGVVVAAAAGELLPDVVHEKSLWAVIIGGAIGVAVMLAVKQLAEKASSSMSLIVTVGVALLGGLSGPTLAAFFAFGLVALLYLVTEELLVEAHEIPDTPLTTAIFFVGFLLLIVIEEMIR